MPTRVRWAIRSQSVDLWLCGLDGFLADGSGLFDRRDRLALLELHRIESEITQVSGPTARV